VVLCRRVRRGSARARARPRVSAGPASSRTVYRGKVLDLVVEDWDGHDREIVVHPGSVAVVAVDGDRSVTLVRQLREPARRHLLELPAGTIEPREDPLAAAKRELAEEAGLKGGRWSKLGSFFTTPGFCNERMDVFLAEQVERGEASPQSDEAFELVRWRVDELEQHLGVLEDAKTIAGLLLFLRTQP
jgi:ADP-ribose pyrophosphatase